MKKHVILITLVALLLAPALFKARTAQAEETKIKKWTFMVFMNADNDLDEFGVEDIKEMERAGLSDDVNAVVQIDRFKLPARRYDVSGRSFQSTADDWGIKSKKVMELNEVDMGDFKELVKFVKWAKEKYPAQNYMLTVWNHGAGWKKRGAKGGFKGISYDDDSNNHISAKELGVAMTAIHGILGKPLDVFGMDACLMQMIEVAYELKDGTRYIVASEETEPGDGWPYHLILGPLYKNPSMDARGLAKMIPQAYFQSYFNAHDEPGDSPYSRNNKAGNSYSKRVKSTTLSAIDCSYIDDLVCAIDSLSETLITTVSKNKSELQAVASAVAGSQKFYAYDNVDLGDLIHYMSQNTRNKDIKEAADKVKMIYKKVIVENKLTGDAKKDATGLAIYFPMETFEEAYSATKFANTLWDELIQLVLASNPIFDPDQIDDTNL
jgi:clostripain